MKTADENNIGQDRIPKQQKGTEMNAVEKTVFNSDDEAQAFYKIAKQRLLDVGHWAEIAEIPMSTFTLTDGEGKKVHRQALQGDYIKINIPGPGTKTGDGFDWVVIEEINEDTDNDTEVLTMRVRPAPNPLSREYYIAHFLKEDATSTFQVKRVGHKVYAEEHARNEMPNIETAHIMDNIRNLLVGWGAKIGFSYPQWKSLVIGIVKKEADS